MDEKRTITGMDIGNVEDGSPKTVDISFPTPSDETVVGAGMPITMNLYRKMVKDYNEEQQKIYDALSELKDDVSSLGTLRDKLNADTEVVSGVYGKDTLMHILSQPGCEGIRYVNCIFNKKKSIVLFGVDVQGAPIRIQNPISEEILFYEVKGFARTRKQVADDIEKDKANVSQIGLFLTPLL